jgi:hypothetical protein
MRKQNKKLEEVTAVDVVLVLGQFLLLLVRVPGLVFVPVLVIVAGDSDGHWILR